VNPERWQQVEQVYSSALRRKPDQRATFLSVACQDDLELRREVEALLQQASETPSDSSWQDTATMQPASSPGIVSSCTELDAGQQLGPYRVEAIIGVGGMGQVYRAVDTRLGRKVAIKVSAQQFSGRFEREARATSALNHPHICTLYDVGALRSGSSYLVTELVEGETLREWLKHAHSPERCIEVARQVLEALRAAHVTGIVHRDLKPANIMVRFDGYVKVLDFGLAKRFALTEEGTTADLSLPGQVVGTIAYMSPEQIQGHDVGPASDLFAFGVILHEMLTGEHPWPRNAAPVDTLHAILHDDPPPIHAASLARWARIVEKLLRKDPAQRYASASEVLDALAASGATQLAADPKSERRAAPPPAPASEAPSTSPALISIAVLPFVFLNEVEQHKALSLGFADALITTLGNLKDIAVTPTSAIVKLAEADPAQVCQDLAVRYVLQGNVQKLGAQWRVSLQLFDATTRKIAFSEKQDFKLENVFDVQDEIGACVVASLQSRFSVAAPKKTRERYTSDPEAYGEFMAGLHESTSNFQATLESAVHHLSKAAELDPGFALAHATLSYTCANVYFLNPQRAWIERASHHCEHALTLDPDLPEGHLARAWILWSPEKNFQHAEAIAALEKVLAAQPNLERAHNRMSAICAHIGRLKEAAIADERARLCNPKTKARNLGYNFLYVGDFERAEVAAKAWLAEVPVWPHAASFAAECALMNRDLDLVAERLAAGFSCLPDDPMLLSLQSAWYACRGDKTGALECAHKSLESPQPFIHIHHAYHRFAETYAMLGNLDKAMGWLQRAAETGFPCWCYFRLDPHLENLRQLPAFHTLVDGWERKYSALKISHL